MILGIDYGRKRIGIAATDGLGVLCFPVETISAGPKAIERILELASERDAEGLVVGLPMNMDGTEGQMAREARKFGERLGEASGLPVNYFDERLTSFDASRRLTDAGVEARKQKGRIDAVAAQLMLQAWMEAQQAADAPGEDSGEQEC